MRLSQSHLQVHLLVVALSMAGLTPGALAADPNRAEGGGARSGDRSESFRAFWADAFHSGFKSTSQINSMVSRAVTGNYNAIVAEVLAYHDIGEDAHGAYWDSGLVPKASDITGDLDPLGYLITAAHASGIEVHAWVVPYRVCTDWPPNGNSLLEEHPEWLMVPMAYMGGGPATIGGKYVLDPGSPDVQDYLVGIVRELVTNYEIDGINYDYIRYTSTDAGYPADESYAKSSLARFQAFTGYEGTPPPTGEGSWNDFRRRTINELVRRSRVEIASIASNPRQPLRLTADLITFGDAPSNFTYSDAYALHQNWKYWMQQGWLDAGIPMNYKREWYPPQNQWYRNWIDAALDWRYDRHMFCGQANYLNPKADSITQLQYSLDAGADGTCNYSYYATADENRDGGWENDWTWYTYVSNNLFTAPVSTPNMSWRDPTTAVEGTLWGQVVDVTGGGEPIDGAVVRVGSLSPVETDGNGYYVVTLIPADAGGTAYDIMADTPGCPELTIEHVVVLPGEVVGQDINLCPIWGGPGDMDEDGDIDLDDLAIFAYCMEGSGGTYPDGHVCRNGDGDDDQDVDLADFVSFQTGFTSP